MTSFLDPIVVLLLSSWALNVPQRRGGRARCNPCAPEEGGRARCNPCAPEEGVLLEELGLPELILKKFKGVAPSADGVTARGKCWMDDCCTGTLLPRWRTADIYCLSWVA